MSSKVQTCLKFPTVENQITQKSIIKQLNSEVQHIGKTGSIFFPNPSTEQQDTDLIRQGNDGILSGDTGYPAVKVFAAGSQDRAVGPKTPAFDHHRHITQDVPLPLVIQTLENMGAVHCRLKGEHLHAGSFERHGSYKLSLCEREQGRISRHHDHNAQFVKTDHSVDSSCSD